MERIFIDREWCIAYAVLALNSIYHSANKERTITDFAEEIKTMLDVHQDEKILMNLKKQILLKEGEYKIKVTKPHKRASGNI